MVLGGFRCLCCVGVVGCLRLVWVCVDFGGFLPDSGYVVLFWYCVLVVLFWCCVSLCFCAMYGRSVALLWTGCGLRWVFCGVVWWWCGWVYLSDFGLCGVGII